MIPEAKKKWTWKRIFCLFGIHKRMWWKTGYRYHVECLWCGKHKSWLE